MLNRPSPPIDFAGAELATTDFDALAEAGATLRDAIELGREAFARLHDSARLELREVGREACVSLVTFPHEAMPFAAAFAERAITTMAQIARSITGRELRATGVRFAHSQPSTAADLDAFFGCRVTFGESENAIAFPIIYLSLELPRRSQMEFLAAEESPTPSSSSFAAAESSSTEEPLLPAIRAHVAAELKHGDPSLAHVASLMGYQPRTLQRRLHSCGTTFQDLLEEIRRALALQYVGTGSSPLAEVARDLGFREASAFSRAFRRWTGETPRDYRSMARRRHVTSPPNTLMASSSRNRPDL
jgi:AraC-like DNA-binding protein